ncbi:MAG: hypothetical protein IKT98_07025 [Selenomonadaceae bacterium]|nr:hypothetical protein [Selenomonadaceae bacterium]
MRNAAKILAILAIIIFMTGEVDAAEFKINSGKNFVEQRRSSIPMKVPRRFEEPPREIYRKRYPVRPIPRYYPTKPRPSRDIRGGGRRNFVPPQHH